LGGGFGAGREDAVVDQTVRNPLVQIGTQQQDDEESEQHRRDDDPELKGRPPQVHQPPDRRQQRWPGTSRQRLERPHNPRARGGQP